MKVLSDPTSTRELEDSLIEALAQFSSESIPVKISVRPEAWEETVSYSDDHDIWWFMKDHESGNRTWNVFGLGRPEPGSTVQIDSELNFSLTGPGRRVAGAFIENGDEVLVGHRGIMGGGRPGVGKNLFFEEFRGRRIEVQDGSQTSQMAWVASLSSTNVLKEIAWFVEEVARIKRLGASGTGPLDSRTFWWVNQNKTFKHEVGGGYMWSPKTKRNGASNYFYDTMPTTNTGDVVFSFAGTMIKAAGIVLKPGSTYDQPAELVSPKEPWLKDGWLVPVEYTELAKPIRPKDHMNLIAPTLPNKYSPLREDGNGNENCYLTELPADMAAVLVGLLDGQVEDIVSGTQSSALRQLEDDEAETEVTQRTDIGETEKQQLVKSRRGQGRFKSNVKLFESACRVTGVKEPAHLRASHIKPWKDSDDYEKLDGNNGLLLAPHVDHLFDRGLISFANDGEMLRSSILSDEVLNAWGIDLKANVGEINKDQKTYLRYHRSKILKK